MACGLPVVATNVGGIPEVVDDGVTGILVKPKSTSEIAKAVSSLLANKKLMASMRKAARDRATMLYNIEGWKNRELFIYRTVMM